MAPVHTDPKVGYTTVDPDSVTVAPAFYAAYKNRCPLCIPPRLINVVYKLQDHRHQILQIINRSPKGLAQLEWIKATNLIPNFDIDGMDNHIPLCVYHGLAWSAGHIVLCPPFEDLDVMIKFEEDDWERRVKADIAVGDCPRRVPPLNKLSGYLNCVLLGPLSPRYLKELPRIAVSCCDELFPHQLMHMVDHKVAAPNVRIIGPVRGKAKAPFNVGLLLNPPDQPYKWTLNPYACLTHALGLLNGAYIPADIFHARYSKAAGGFQAVLMPDPIDGYESRLLRLRELYSRTHEDLQVARTAATQGIPLDDN